MTEKNISNKIKKILLDDFSKNNKKGLYSLTQKVMAYNSNKIEGSTLTSEQTASLFDTGTITSNGIEVYKAKDIEEMQGHFKMFNQMLKYIDEPLSIDLIKSYHYQLKNGVFEDLANGYPIGEFKNRPNIVSDIQTVTPNNVASEIKKIINEYSESEKTLFDIAAFHAKYENIHPFQDGNGRTGRIIMFKQCLDNNLIPIIVKDDNKLIYYKALHLAQVDNNYDQLVAFFKTCQKEYYILIQNYLSDYLENNLDNKIKNPYIDDDLEL